MDSKDFSHSFDPYLSQKSGLTQRNQRGATEGLGFSLVINK